MAILAFQKPDKVNMVSLDDKRASLKSIRWSQAIRLP